LETSYPAKEPDMTEKLFLTEPKEILDRIRALFEQASVIKCAVAFWGDRAPFILGLRGLNKPIQIICNFESGATNPQVVRELLDIPGLQLRSHHKLHAKVYWTAQGAIVGSSNASANGLGFEGRELEGWLEANALVTDTETLVGIKSWFDDLWNRAVVITPTQIKRMEKNRRKR
jgi:HKD family nuclease